MIHKIHIARNDNASTQQQQCLKIDCPTLHLPRQNGRLPRTWWSIKYNESSVVPHLSQQQQQQQQHRPQLQWRMPKALTGFRRSGPAPAATGLPLSARPVPNNGRVTMTTERSKKRLSRMNCVAYIGHATTSIFSWMLTTASCLVVGLGLGLGLGIHVVSGW